MKKILFTLLILPLLTVSQTSYNMSLLGTYEWPTTEGNDIWGWVSPISEDEYALVGLNDGFSCVNVSDPSNPVEEFYIPDMNSTWRDVKTWGNYAYVTTEADAGLLIIDLTDMTGGTYWHVSNFINPNGSSVTFTAAHNLYIDENGICYIFGASSSNGGSPSDGAIFLDVNTNPINPVYLGEWDEEYIHDGMARGDTMYAGCIYTGDLYIVDVSNKTNPVVLGTHQTPNAFTHNAWVSDDGNYVFTTDETSDAYIGSYDISDVSNIQEVDRIQSNPESNSIPHNTHVDGNFLVTSWYRDGTTVHDISNPHNLVQVAYYDSYTGSPSNQYQGDGFDGCWGTYPFLPSGIIISSDINSSSNGNARLLIYERGFSGACYLEGNVTDGSSGATIVGATVILLNTTIPNSSNTNLSGSYTSGNADAGNFDVVFSMLGYISDTLQATLINGQVTILNAVLNIDPNVPILGCMDASANNYNPNANTALEYGGEIDNTFSSGGYSNGNKHLIFDASTDLVIKSAVFYAEDPKTITFELRSSSGTVIDDTTHTLMAGQQQLDLNFEVPMGSDMQLGIANGNSGLYRNNSGAIYPYLIGSIMNIIGASNQSTQDNWYYFYNIEVEVPCENTTTSVSELPTSKNLLKIVDVLGREIHRKKNTPLFYIFDDGTVEKRLIIE